MSYFVFLLASLLLLFRNWICETFFGETSATYWLSFHVITDISLWFFSVYVLLNEKNKWKKMSAAICAVIITKDTMDRTLLNVYWYTWSDFIVIGFTLLIFSLYKPWKQDT